MSQSSIEPSGAQSGAGFSSAVRSALAAVATWFSGASAPASTGQPFAHQFWIDTANGVIKQRNSANTAWVAVALMNNWHVNALGENCKGEVLDADRTQYLYSADLVSVEGTVLSAVSLTLDTNTTPGSVGGNCLDTGAWAVTTWYAIYLICSDDGATKALLASTNATSPTLPSGFTRKRRVGWARTISGTATNLWPMLQTGKHATWTTSNGQDHVVLALQTNPATSFTDIDCSAGVPPATRQAWIEHWLYVDPTWSGTQGTGCFLELRPKGSTSNGDAVAVVAGATHSVICERLAALDTSRVQQYRVTLNGGALATDLNVMAWARGWLDPEQQ